MVAGANTIRDSSSIFFRKVEATISTKNELCSCRGENGKLPLGIEEAELAFLYKVL